MDEETAAVVRRTGMAPDYPHPAHAEVAGDPAPCRVCLDRFEPGAERRLLFTHDPFRAAIDRVLGAPGVEYVHVRSTRAGCFVCRLDPVPAAA
jgi:hypothetical protein